MLPENLKKQKETADGGWSNVALDLGVAALTYYATSKLHFNPSALKLATTGATLTGRIAAGGLMLGTATVGRHYGHELLTGNSESWTTSTIHGAAGLAELGVIAGVRGKLGNLYFKGANTESALLRVAQSQGTGEALTSGALKDLYAANKWAIPKELAALESSTVIVKDGAVVKSLDLGLDAAKSAELAKASLSEPAQNFMVRGIKSVWNLPGNTARTVTAIVNPKELDLATATAKQISARGTATGFVSALAGSETYQAITALDRRFDSTTGDYISYGRSFADNMLSLEPLTDALMIAPFIKPGIMPRNFYAEGGRNAWSTVKNVFNDLKPSGALAHSENAMTRVATSAVPIGLGTARTWQGPMNRGVADQVQDLIDQEAGH